VSQLISAFPTSVIRCLKVVQRELISRKNIASLLLLASTGVALPTDLAGQASIIDGDTLEIHGTRIRLWGIDAPESTQLCRGEDSLQYRCGAKAANDLGAFIAGRAVSCVPVTLDGSIRADRGDVFG
jgi:endonuclease YncB( thermonuclease family)